MVEKLHAMVSQNEPQRVPDREYARSIAHTGSPDRLVPKA